MERQHQNPPYLQALFKVFKKKVFRLVNYLKSKLRAFNIMQGVSLAFVTFKEGSLYRGKQVSARAK